jgi:hypothetical protein
MSKRSEKVDARIITMVDPDTGLEYRQLLIDGEPIMGASEVAEALGIRVQNLQFVKNLPEPVDRPRATRIWLGSEIHEFARATGRIATAA